MATYTEKYGLKKPGRKDNAIIKDLNDNADKVDQVLQNKADLKGGVILAEQIPPLGGYYTKEEADKIREEVLVEAKEYTDNEIAEFDIVKIVQSLPETGLPNRIYFVPKKDAITNDLFDEYMWADGDWEFFGTKSITIDLSNYVKKTDTLKYGGVGLARLVKYYGLLVNESNGNLTLSEATLANLLAGKTKGSDGYGAVTSGNVSLLPEVLEALKYAPRGFFDFIKSQGEAYNATAAFVEKCKSEYGLRAEVISPTSFVIRETFQMLPGDANGDGVVDWRDKERLKKYLADMDDETGISSCTVSPGADVNGDGKINTGDINWLTHIIEDQPYLRGDANGDGVVDWDDWELLMQYVGAGGEGISVAPGADFDGNGKVNLADALALMQLLDAQDKYIIRGDVNGDGIVDQRDLDRLREHMSNITDWDNMESPVKVAPGADVNGDGIIDSNDVLALEDILKDQSDQVEPLEFEVTLPSPDEAVSAGLCFGTTVITESYRAGLSQECLFKVHAFVLAVDTIDVRSGENTSYTWKQIC